MSDVIHVDDNNFEAEVINSTVPVLVDFGATWCGPCQRQLPILEKYATENLSKIKVVSIDIDDAPQIAVKLGIRSVPTLILFQVGVPVGSKIGLTSMAEVSNFVLAKIGS